MRNSDHYYAVSALPAGSMPTQLALASQVLTALVARGDDREHSVDSLVRLAFDYSHALLYRFCFLNPEEPGPDEGVDLSERPRN